MAKQSKNKVKLNSKYEHLGTFTKSALKAIRASTCPKAQTRYAPT